ncbi:MAG: Uma2 family endonuclease [Betaproteobacteria bacterium]|nr:Uma2 family endonuclease [Betaproteobacteria bacterium]
MAAHPVTNPATHYTWNDYQTWPDDERWEIIDGTAYAKSPAPSTQHQSVALALAGRLERLLAGKPCRPFIAPTDVKLSDAHVVQPDILVVCDASKITPSHIEGAPDLIIEVLSPATATRDLREKKALYEKSGVREYVVVDPMEHYANRFLLGADGSYDKGAVVAADEKLIIASFDGIEIPLWEVFGVTGPQPAPDETA